MKFCMNSSNNSSTHTTMGRERFLKSEKNLELDAVRAMDRRISISASTNPYAGISCTHSFSSSRCPAGKENGSADGSSSMLLVDRDQSNAPYAHSRGGITISHQMFAPHRMQTVPCHSIVQAVHPAQEARGMKERSGVRI